MKNKKGDFTAWVMVIMFMTIILGLTVGGIFLIIKELNHIEEAKEFCELEGGEYSEGECIIWDIGDRGYISYEIKRTSKDKLRLVR